MGVCPFWFHRRRFSFPKKSAVLPVHFQGAGHKREEGNALLPLSHFQHVLHDTLDLFQIFLTEHRKKVRQLFRRKVPPAKPAEQVNQLLRCIV